MFGYHRYILVLKSIEEYHLWVRPDFSNRAQHVLFVFLGWIVWWEISGHIVIAFYVVNSWICSKQLTTFLCCSYPAVSVSVSSESKCCKHTVVLTLLHFEKLYIIIFGWVDEISVGVKVFTKRKDFWYTWFFFLKKRKTGTIVIIHS